MDGRTFALSVIPPIMAALVERINPISKDRILEGARIGFAEQIIPERMTPPKDGSFPDAASYRRSIVDGVTNAIADTAQWAAELSAVILTWIAVTNAVVVILAEFLPLVICAGAAAVWTFAWGLFAVKAFSLLDYGLSDARLTFRLLFWTIDFEDRSKGISRLLIAANIFVVILVAAVWGFSKLAAWDVTNKPEPSVTTACPVDQNLAALPESVRSAINALNATQHAIESSAAATARATDEMANLGSAIRTDTLIRNAAATDPAKVDSVKHHLATKPAVRSTTACPP